MDYLAWHQVFSNYHNINFKPNGKTEKIQIRQNLSGNKIQVELSNEYDNTPLKIMELKVSLNSDFKDYVKMTLNGKTRFDVPALNKVWTDSIDFKVPHEQDLFFELQASNDDNKLSTSANLLSRKIVCTNINEKNNFLYGLTSVKLSSEIKKIVNIGFFGDSLTNQGYFSDSVLQFLYKKKEDIKFTGYNAGISGNRLLLPGTSESEWSRSFGQAGIKRFDKDVLQYKPDMIVTLLGSNDLFHPGTGSSIKELPNLKSMIDGYEYLSELSKKESIIFIPMTIPPFKGAANNGKCSWSQEKEGLRNSINKWLMKTYKNCIDVDYYVKKTTLEAELNPNFDSGDHLHFSENGGEVLGKYIAKTLLTILED